MAYRRLPVALNFAAWLPRHLQAQQQQLQHNLLAGNAGERLSQITRQGPSPFPPGGWGTTSRCMSSALSVAHADSTTSVVSTHVLGSPLSPCGDRIHVLIKTGNLRGAGTTCPAFITLVGSKGESDPVVVGDSEDYAFDRDTIRAFDIILKRDIGQLRRIHLARGRELSGQLGAGWFLEQVEVLGCGDEHIVFPCHAWFGDSDCGEISGALERNLLPAAEPSLVEECRPVTVKAAGMAIPHPDKVLKEKMRGVNRQGFGYGGEDAYFYCHGRNNVFGMGVADGIYAWKDQGIDSGKMARALMEVSQHLVQAGCEDVFKALHTAARHTQSEGILGSSTACVLTINQEQGQLHAANLGDSGFLLLSPHGESGMTVKYRTNQLEHEFGRPFQLGHHEHASLAVDADLASVQVSAGDVVVMGSDGLLDNLSEVEIMQVVSSMRRSGKPPSAVVQHLVKLAFEASVDKKRSTPYSKSASEAFDMVFAGGKPDDITVLVAYCE